MLRAAPARVPTATRGASPPAAAPAAPRRHQKPRTRTDTRRLRQLGSQQGDRCHLPGPSAEGHVGNSSPAGHGVPGPVFEDKQHT